MMDTSSSLEALRRSLTTQRSNSLREALEQERQAQHIELTQERDAQLRQAEEEFKTKKEKILKEYEVAISDADEKFEEEVEAGERGAEEAVWRELREAVLGGKDEVAEKQGSFSSPGAKSARVVPGSGAGKDRNAKRRRTLDRAGDNARSERSPSLGPLPPVTRSAHKDEDEDDNDDDDDEQDPPSNPRSAKRRRIEESSSPPSVAAATATVQQQTSLMTPSATPSESQDQAAALMNNIPATQNSSALALEGVDEGFATWSDVFLSLDPSPNSASRHRRILCCADADSEIAGPAVREQIEREIRDFATKLKDWTKMSGGPICLRKAVSKRSSKDLGVYACEFCSKRKRLCIRSVPASPTSSGVRRRCLVVVPLPHALRVSQDSKKLEFWAMGKPGDASVGS
jgi:hypothetical protein